MITAFGTPVYLSGNCDMQYVYDLDYIKEAIGNIIMTRLGEIPLSDFGSRVAALLFDQADSLSVGQLKAEIREPLQKWLPIIAITDAGIFHDVATAADRAGMSAVERDREDHTIRLIVGFTVLATGVADQAEITLRRAA